MWTPGHVIHPCVNRTLTPLAPWLARLRSAGWGIAIENGEPHLVSPSGYPEDFDEETCHLLDRYRHALLVAAARTHPHWWDHVSGRTIDLPATINDIPANGDAWACTTCGSPADELGGDLLAFCPEHAA